MTYFSIEELCYSSTAVNNGIKNVPDEAERAALVALIDNVLDPTRERFKRPIRVTSGFRCARVNSLPSIRGAKNSQHTKGQAADLVCQKEGVQGNYLIGKLIIQCTDFDQVIFENVGANDMLPQWIHVSYKSKEENRHQILKKVKGVDGYKVVDKSKLGL